MILARAGTSVEIEGAEAAPGDRPSPARPRGRGEVGWVPRQHGAWTILVGGFALGAAVGGFSPWQAPLLGAIFAGFLARHAASLSWRTSPADGRPRRRLAGTREFTLLFVALGATPVVFGDLWGLVPIGAMAIAVGAASVAIERRHGAFSAPGETLGVLGLCLSAPAAEYAGAGAITARTAGVGLLTAAFFLGGLLRVRYLVRHRRESAGPQRARVRTGWTSVTYQGIVCLAIAALPAAVPGLLPRQAVLALVPGALQAASSILRRRSAPEPVRRIGRMELFHAVVFLVLAAWAYGVPSS